MAGDAPDRVVMQSPAKDAAVLAKMQGLVNNRKAKTLSGLSRTINDGVVIRKSTIKDGKIIIPPSGLYITVRSTNWHPFDNEPLTLAGKTYHAITDRYVRDVIRNVTMKKGQVLPSNANKSRGWELSSVENDTYGIEGGQFRRVQDREDHGQLLRFPVPGLRGRTDQQRRRRRLARQGFQGSRRAYRPHG